MSEYIVPLCLDCQMMGETQLRDAVAENCCDCVVATFDRLRAELEEKDAELDRYKKLETEKKQRDQDIANARMRAFARSLEEDEEAKAEREHLAHCLSKAMAVEG